VNRLRIAAILAVTAGFGAVLARGFAPERAGTKGFWLLIILAYLAASFASLAWAFWQREADFMLPRWGDMTRGFFAAAFLFGVSFGMVKLFVAHTPREEWILRIYEQLGDTNVLREKYGRICFVIFIASAGEEIVWRGMVTRVLEPVIGSRRAWIASAILYACAHVPTIWVLHNPGLVLAALGFGLAMGVLVRLSGGRIPPAIVAHTLFDIAVTMMFRLVGNSV